VSEEKSAVIIAFVIVASERKEPASRRPDTKAI
jgi:hypothetical protein